MTFFKLSTTACLAGLLAACGGSIGHDTPTPGSGPEQDSSSSESSSAPANGNGNGNGESLEPNVRQGAFLDSPVENIQYSTATQSGVTSSEGWFHYLVGEQVTFAIGDLEFPPVLAQATLTPLEIAGTGDLQANTVVNMVRLLLSLDVDGDPTNGISIDDQAFGAATQVDFELSPEDFAASPQVQALLSGSGSSQSELVATSVAMDHFQGTLNSSVNQRVVASADGSGETYELFDAAFGGTAVESPVCDYQEDDFGRRITEVEDDTLGEPVFAFHILRDVDGDRCIESITDRQRIEVKTYGASPEDRVASQGEVHTYRWKFKLDSGFQPSSSFTHVFQIKAAGGDDDGMPIITFTPRAGSPDHLEVLHAADGDSGTDQLASVPLSELAGQWVEAYVRTRYDFDGSLEIGLTRMDDGEQLIAWSHNDIDMWREGADIGRPKWGIYRSLNQIDDLRDETVWFNDFCIAEGTNTCPSALDPELTVPDNGDDAPDFGFEDESVGEAPEGFEVEGNITVSDERAREGEQSVKFSHLVDEQVRMRRDFGSMDTGSLKVSIRVPEGVGVDSLVTLYAESYNSANRAIDIIFKPDGTIRRREGSSQEDVMPYTHGEWVDLEIQWQDLSNSNEFSLWVNGDEVGVFPVATSSLTPERVEFKFGQNSAAISGEDLFIDAISISDVIGGGDSPQDPAEEPDYTFEEDIVGEAPAGFEVEGQIEVSADLAIFGAQSVRFSHPEAGQQVRMRREWGAASSGSLKAAVFIPADVGVDTLITVYAEAYNSTNRSIDLLFKPDGSLRRREGSSQEEVMSYTFDSWNEVEIHWENIDSSNEFSLWLNGIELGTFPVATENLIPERVEFKFGGNADAVSDESIYVDAISAF